MIRILRFNSSDNNLLEKALNIRKNVFVEEQKIPKELEYDEYDIESNHYLVLYDNVAVGTARWRNTSKGIKLERFAVLSEYRSKGIGYVLVREVLNDVIVFRSAVYLHAQSSVVRFYEKYNFKIKGNAFAEAGIEHYLMELEIK